MNCTYIKVIVKGSPITKSNFKLSNKYGRSILPYNSGKYHDRYAIYEETIAYEARIQNPNKILEGELIAFLKVYYKSEKRHPDTTNISKSIFDGIEKSGIIINDSQVVQLIVKEFYDKKNPRFELELFSKSHYEFNCSICKRKNPLNTKKYSPPPNKKNLLYNENILKTNNKTSENNIIYCNICGNKIPKNKAVSANKGSILICRECLKKLF
ncbi:endodeoxyribonuclease RusA [Clostridium acetireducens DSM 10703]|jgi:Holliday junction resolvase RusA-like endonuclease|uniref:Endodeoxyribonuclease RusA n=1 Tax=Clostridium acetireducens DSM 10703 TaxID=1121290 RepID=A0A1E8EX91_9CLOT|nr:RusA family crossover junction endodeoxyribonuclease [Clostridium acetireducens]OFI04988.1 endodeoxyribonuclease RusA [Clostridium acetireducens DSM 10703]